MPHLARAPVPAFLAPVGRRERDLKWIAAWFGLGVVLSFAATAVIGYLLGLFAPDLLATMSDMQPEPEGADRLWREIPFIGMLALLLALTAGCFLLAASACFQRPIVSFLAPTRRFSVGVLAAGFVTSALLVLGTVWIEGVITGEALAPPVLDPGWPLASRVAYAAASAPLILIAASAEEAICRGVLLQISGALSRRAVVICAINGLVFAAMHVDMDPGAFVSRFISGFVFAWTTLRLAGLEFAIGLHFANNLALAWFFEPFSEAAQPNQGYPPLFLIADVAGGLVALAVAEAIARRRVRLNASAAAAPPPAARPDARAGGS